MKKTTIIEFTQMELIYLKKAVQKAVYEALDKGYYYGWEQLGDLLLKIREAQIKGIED